MAGSRGQHNPKPELCKKRRPEGIVFIHIQDARNADFSAGGIFERRIPEYAFQLILHQVRHIVLFCAPSRSAFTAVAGNMLFPCGKAIDRQHTVVGAAPAVAGFCRVGEIQDLFHRQHGRILPMIMLPGNQRRSECPHNT